MSAFDCHGYTAHPMDNPPTPPEGFATPLQDYMAHPLDPDASVCPSRWDSVFRGDMRCGRPQGHAGAHLATRDKEPYQWGDGLAGMPARLTNRQLDVLLGIADGKSLQQIADESYLSLSTIAHYVRQILTALDANNRTHAVAIAFRIGVLR